MRPNKDIPNGLILAVLTDFYDNGLKKGFIMKKHNISLYILNKILDSRHKVSFGFVLQELLLISAFQKKQVSSKLNN